MFEEFLSKTDAKSLKTQIKNYVRCAQKVARDQVEQRRKKLKFLLDAEVKKYELEFAEKVKSRINEDIKARTQVLLKKSEDNARVEQKFLEMKRAQQLLVSCYDLRQVLRERDEYNMRAIQLQQIVEKQNALKREREAANAWAQLYYQKDVELTEREANEDENQRLLNMNTKHIWDDQLLEINRLKELERLRKIKETEEFKKNFHELRIEENCAKVLPPEIIKYRQDLLETIAEHKEKAATEKAKKAAEDRQMWIDWQMELQNDKLLRAERKKELNKTSMEYLKYSRQIRQAKENIDKLQDQCWDQLAQVEYCTKNVRYKTTEQKAKNNAEHFVALQQQIEHDRKRRKLDNEEQRKNGFYKNHFARSEEDEVRLEREKRMRNREELELQIVEDNKTRALQKLNPKPKIFYRVTEPISCQEVGGKYLHHLHKYLPVHPNWRYCDTHAEIGAGDSVPKSSHTKI